MQQIKQYIFIPLLRRFHLVRIYSKTATYTAVVLYYILARRNVFLV